jgi:hypothetical protein
MNIESTAVTMIAGVVDGALPGIRMPVVAITTAISR